jgi:hypothetical protein
VNGSPSHGGTEHLARHVSTHSHNTLQGVTRCEQESTNGRRPPAVPGIAPRYSGRRFDPRRPLTPYERTLHAGTARPCPLLCSCRAGPGNRVFCIWQPCARDSGNKTAASAHGMGSGGLSVDAMAIGCLGVERRGERCQVLCVFITGGPITKLFAGGEEESGGHVL